MKWVFRLSTMAFLLAAIGLPFFINNQHGEPMLSLPTTEDLLPSAETTAKVGLPSVTTTEVFKWQDEHGVWHYGDSPPEGLEKVESLAVDTRTNVIQGFVPPSTGPGAAPETTANRQMTSPTDGILTLDRAMNVMQDAQLAAELMEQRNQQLKSIVGEQEQ